MRLHTLTLTILKAATVITVFAIAIELGYRQNKILGRVPTKPQTSGETITRQNIIMDQQIFAVSLTPEMMERLTQLNRDVLKLIQERTKTPEEAFIVLDGVKRNLELMYGMVLVAPLDYLQSGQS